MATTVSIDDMADEIMKGLQEYADLAADKMKSAVKKSANTVKKEIQENAPQRTGTYAKSWRTKTVTEKSDAMEIVVYSPKRYMLAHLLEHGHAKRGGGRVEGKQHIKPAEETGVRQLETEIEKALGGG